MDEKMDVIKLIEGLARCGLSKQQIMPNDYFDQDGLLICGLCGEKKRVYVPISAPTKDNPNETKQLLVKRDCKCVRDAHQKEEKEKRLQSEMEEIRKLKDASLMDDRFTSSTFDNFQTTQFNERNLKLCRRYATAFDKMLDNNQGLVFWGDVGTGKSFAAACIANYLLDRKVPVVMTSFVKLLNAIQKDGKQEDVLLNRMNRAKLVVLDDLGAERDTGYGIEKVYHIIDSRYRKKLPMILTTNLTLNQMKEEMDVRYKRIYDRIFESCYPMQFTGPSFRKVEANRRFTEMTKLLEGD